MNPIVELDDPFETCWLEARGFDFEMEKDGNRYAFEFKATPELAQARKEFIADNHFQKFIACRKALRKKMWGYGKYRLDK